MLQLAFLLAEVKAAESHDGKDSDNEWDYQQPTGITAEALSDIAEVSLQSIEQKIVEQDALKKKSTMPQSPF